MKTKIITTVACIIGYLILVGFAIATKVEGAYFLYVALGIPVLFVISILMGLLTGLQAGAVIGCLTVFWTGGFIGLLLCLTIIMPNFPGIFPIHLYILYTGVYMLVAYVFLYVTGRYNRHIDRKYSKGANKLIYKIINIKYGILFFISIYIIIFFIIIQFFILGVFFGLFESI